MERTEQIIDMIEHPERYTEEQMEEMLSDEESRKTYLTMVEMRMAFEKEDVAEADDTDEQWRKFAGEHGLHGGEQGLQGGELGLRSGGFQWRKVAAIFIGVLMISGIALAAIRYGIFSRQEAPAAEVVEATADTDAPADTTSTVRKADAAKEHIQKVFENVALADMLNEMGVYYEMEVIYNRPEAKELRFYYEWDSNKSIEAIANELNNSEQIHITISEGKIIVE